MIKRFNEFINEEINIGGFEVAGQYDIDINLTDEITVEELIEIQKDFIQTSFDKEELIKLNGFFGIWKLKNNIYPFKMEFGGFGTPLKKLSGTVKKYRNFDKNNNQSIYIVELNLNVKLGNDFSRKHYLLKFNSLDELFEILNSFEE